MQSFVLSLYLYNVKTIQHLLLLAFLGCATAVCAPRTLLERLCFPLSYFAAGMSSFQRPYYAVDG